MLPRLLPLLLAVLLTACASEKRFDVRGEIVGFGDNDSTVIVAHEAISGFMPAMTMPLVADAPVSALEYGDKVGFVLHVTRERSWISGIAALPDTVTLALAEQPSRLPTSPGPPDEVLYPGDAVPPLTLIGDDGEPFSLADYRGQVLVLDFIYTRCPLPDFCPLLSRRFAELQKTYADDERVQLLSITLDPEYDTPEVLRQYREHYTDTPDGWRFATGTPQQLDSVYALFGQYVLGGGADLQHNLVTVVVGADGRLRRFLTGKFWTVEAVMEEVAEAR